MYEGEHDLTIDNNFLKQFTVSGIPAVPKGTQKFDDTFHIGSNGIIYVSAVNQNILKSRLASPLL